MLRRNNKIRQNKKDETLIERFHNNPVDRNILLRVILIIFLLFILSDQLHNFLFRTEYELGIQSLDKETYMPSLYSQPQFYLKKD